MVYITEKWEFSEPMWEIFLKRSRFDRYPLMNNSNGCTHEVFPKHPITQRPSSTTTVETTGKSTGPERLPNFTKDEDLAELLAFGGRLNPPHGRKTPEKEGREWETKIKSAWKL